MEVLQFPARQSSASPAKEGWVRGELSGVMTLAFEAIADSILSQPLEGGAEACERRISAALAQAGCGALRVALEVGDAEAEQLVRGGEVYHRGGRQRTTMLSSFGEVAYERQRYRRRGQDSIAPADDRFEILFGYWSPLAARRAGLVLSMAPAGHCEALFREFGGMHPSATALGNLSKGLGPVLEVVEEDALETIRGQEAVPVEARALAISIDGVHVGMRKEKVVRGQGVASVPAGFREASSGTVSLFDGDGERLRTAYHGRMPEAGKATLKRDVLAEAQHWMNLRPDLEVVFIADGAADNWTWCEEVFGGATQIFDYWHAAQHLQDALKSAYGEGSPQAQRHFERLREVLKEEQKGIDKVLRSLQRLARKHPQRGTIPRVLRFFRKQRHRMRYAEFQQRGLPIGSGIVEAANRVLITQRLKCSGMRWSENGTGQAILSLRALWKSDRYGAAWNQIMRAMKPEACQFRSHERRNMLNLVN